MLNDLFRTYKKIIAAVVILLSAIIFWFFGCHRSGRTGTEQTGWKQTAQDIQSYDFYTEHISGNITFGTGGHLSADRTQPVVMNITSKEASFAGTVKITLPGDEGKGIAYQSAVSCSKGYTSKVILSIPKLGNVSFFSVEILDQYGTEELAQMIVGACGIKWASDSSEIYEKKTVYIGILSDNPDKLQWINDLEVVSGQDSLVFCLSELDKKDLWGGAERLASLSGILIDDYDTSALSTKQKNCLKEWVREEGGSLLAGTGVRAKEVLSGLGELMEVSAGGSRENSLQFYNNEESAGYLSVITNKLHFKGDVVWKTDGLSFPVSGYQRQYGLGKLMILTWSLTDDALQQWTGREKMAQELFENFIPKIIQPYSADEDSTWHLKKALYSFLNSQIPNTFYYALFFIVYLSALGFFSYYVLRRIKKMEYIWVIVPAISILFTVCLAIRAKGPGSNALSSYSALEVIDSDRNRHDIFFLYQNNEGESNSVDLIPEVSYVEPLDYSYRTGDENVASLRRLRQDYTINNTQSGYDIAFEEAVPGTSRLLQMVKSVGEDSGTDCFEAEIEADYTSFHGSITNRSAYHFSRVVLIRGNQYRILNDVRSGEKETILADDILCWSGFEQDNSSYGSEEERSAVASLTDYIRNKYINGKEDFNTVIIAGITDDKDITLFSDQGKLQNHQTIFVKRVLLPAEKNTYYISDINKECLGSDKADSLLSQDILEEKKTKAVYQFDRDKVVWLAARNRDSFDGTIYAHNYQTGKDDVILESRDDVMNCQELEPYLSEMNKMTLTFSLKKGQDYGAAPVLTFVLKDVK